MEFEDTQQVAHLASVLPESISPLDAALWLAVNHCGALRSPEGQELADWYGATPETGVAQIENTMSALMASWVAKVQHDMSALPTVKEQLHFALQKIVNQTLAHFELQNYWPSIIGATYFESDVFVRRAGARLVLGASNCDGINHLMGEVLRTDFEVSFLNPRSYRFLRCIHRQTGIAYILDAYLPLPPFTLDANGPPELQAYDALVASHGDEAVSPQEGLYAKSVYDTAKPVLTWPEARTTPWSLDHGFFEGRNAQSDSPIFERYLIARAHHLFGGPADAEAHYRLVIDGDDVDHTDFGCFARFASSQFLARINQPLGGDLPRTAVEEELSAGPAVASTVRPQLPPGLAPVDAALWFVADGSEYMEIEEGEALDEWYRTIDPSIVEGIETAGAALLVAWVETVRTRVNSEPSVEARLKAAVGEVVSLVLGHTELTHRWSGFAEHTYYEGESFQRRAMRHLVLGASNADGVNHLLGEVLCGEFEVQFLNPDGHRFLRCIDRETDVSYYVDAFLPLPPFTLDAHGPERMQRFNALDPELVRIQVGDHSLEPYQAALPVYTWPEATLGDWPLDPRLFEGAEASDASSGLESYLNARVHHLFGATEDAERGYRAALEAHQYDGSHLGGFVPYAAVKFLERLGSPWDPPAAEAAPLQAVERPHQRPVEVLPQAIKEVECPLLPSHIEPLEACLWLVSQEGEFLTVSEGEPLKQWCETVDPAAIEMFETTAVALVEAWAKGVRTRIDAERTVAEGLRRAVYEAVNCLLAPLEVAESGASMVGYTFFENERFAQRGGVQLLLGSSNCDGVNYLLGEVLSEAFHVRFLNPASHRFLECEDRETGVVYIVDGFLPLPPFTLDEQGPEALQIYDALSVSHSRSVVNSPDTVYGRDVYEDAQPVFRWAEKRSIAWPLADDVFDVRAAHVGDSLFGHYLQARAHHLFGEPADAAEHYLKVLRLTAAEASGLDRFAATASSKFLARLSSPVSIEVPRQKTPVCLSSQVPFLVNVCRRLQVAVNDEGALGGQIQLQDYAIKDGELSLSMVVTEGDNVLNRTQGLLMTGKGLEFDWNVSDSSLPAIAKQLKALLNSMLQDYSGVEHVSAILES